MANSICVTCGVQFAATNRPPERCPVCEDPRQYVGYDGQQWTTLETLRQDHHTVIKQEESGLTGVGTDPDFAIGQRALLVQTPTGNVLWDCISLLDDPTIAAVEALGGISAIEGIVSALQPFRYDRLYGGWWQRVVAEDGEAAVPRSTERYMAAIRGE